MPTYMKRRTRELVYAVVIFALLLLGTPEVLVWLRAESQAYQFFEVKQLYVEDFSEGEDGILAYDRIIKGPFRGEWVAVISEVRGQSLYPSCTASGGTDYKPDKVLPPIVTLKWYMQRDCPLTPGRYRIEVKYRITVPNYPDMDYRVVSNVFEVKSKKTG